jgi:hypothetical protein
VQRYAFIFISVGERKIMNRSFENTGGRSLGHFKQNPSIASFQHGMLESSSTWTSPKHPANPIHAGMTKICIFMSAGERTLMSRFVFQKSFVGWRVRDNGPPEKFSQPAKPRAIFFV